MSKKTKKTDLDKNLEAEPMSEADEADVVEAEVVDMEPADAASEDEEGESLAEELLSIGKERDEFKDQLLRARAEFDNYRKRTLRDIERIRKTAAESLVRDLLPVVDNLNRALSHADDGTQGFIDGVKMVMQQFTDILAGHGVKPIPALGQPFDPNVHEALSQLPSNEYASDTVMEEFETGYWMGDAVLRPAKVVVSRGPVEASAEPASQEEEV